MKAFTIALTSFLLAMPFYTSAGSPDNSVYIDGGDNKNAVIFAHGKGKHPTWLVVDPLRKGTNKNLGYHTLSHQRPHDYSHCNDYATRLPSH